MITKIYFRIEIVFQSIWFCNPFLKIVSADTDVQCKISRYDFHPAIKIGRDPEYQ